MWAMSCNRFDFINNFKKFLIMECLHNKRKIYGFSLQNKNGIFPFEVNFVINHHRTIILL